MSTSSRSSSRTRSPLAIALVFAGVSLLAWSSLGCKEGEVLDSNITLADPGFEADAVPPSTTSRFVTISTNSVTSTRIKLDVVLHDIDEDVTGINLKVEYPREFSRFAGCEDGGLFPPGNCLFREDDPGEVVLARTISAPSEATDVVGARTILRMEFIVFAKGEGPLVIEGQNLGNLSAVIGGDGQTPVTPMEWFAGKIVGR